MIAAAKGGAAMRAGIEHDLYRETITVPEVGAGHRWWPTCREWPPLRPQAAGRVNPSDGYW
jgi:hypothetical protein